MSFDEVNLDLDPESLRRVSGCVDHTMNTINFNLSVILDRKKNFLCILSCSLMATNTSCKMSDLTYYLVFPKNKKLARRILVAFN